MSIAKQDIDILTNQILENLKEILQTIYDEHVEIDSSLLYENFREECQKNLNQNSESNTADCEPISLDEFEKIFNRLDGIDRKLADPESHSHEAHRTNTNKTMKRFNSVNDIDKTMMLSTTNLNMTTKFAAPHPVAPVPKPTATSNVPHKYSEKELIEFNSIKEQIRIRLETINSNGNKNDLDYDDVQKIFFASFDRLEIFFREIIKLKSTNTAEQNTSNSLKNLDSDFCDLLKKLSEVCQHLIHTI